MTIIVDASLALAWVLPLEGTARTQDLHERVKREGGVAPHIWRLEVSNIILQSERAGRVTAAEAARIMAMFRALPITVDLTVVDQAFGSVVDLAREQGLTTYDASYLEVAVRLGLPLATQDRALREAAGRIGVEVL